MIMSELLISFLHEQSSRSDLLTGGASGIGRAVTEELHQDPQYGPIYATDISPTIHECFPPSHYPGVKTIELDVRNPEQITAVVNRVIEETGHVGVLLNIAGIMNRGRRYTYFNENGPVQEFT